MSSSFAACLTSYVWSSLCLYESSNVPENDLYSSSAYGRHSVLGNVMSHWTYGASYGTSYGLNQGITQKGRTCCYGGASQR